MENFHNICAIDLGASSSKIAALTLHHRFEILVNEANFRETPSVIAFTNAERLFGDQAIIKMKSNFTNTIKAPQRFIGITNKMHMLEEEMKYSTMKYETTPKNIIFEVQQNSEKLFLSPEQLLTGLFTKFSQICSLNNVIPDSLFITVQSYLTNGEKKAIKTCAESSKFKNVNLVEEWEAILSEYFYVRQSEIESLIDEQIIIFIDFGSSHLGIHACIVGRNKLALIDQEYLRYSGAKNIDNLLVDFYIELVLKESGTDIRTLPKSLIKLQESVEGQRKKLSANKESQLTIECLFGEYDLNYNMKREQFENIAMPVLAEFASAMQVIKSRVEPIGPIHSIEVIGGVSRIPIVLDIVKTIFNIEPGKKMNASESVARGAAIAGANRLGMLKNNVVNFVREVRSPIFMFIHPITQEIKEFYKNVELYTSYSVPIKSIFSSNCLIPSNEMSKIDSTETEILICKEGNIGLVVIGYLKFSGADTLTVLIDNNGIIRARLMKEKFTVYDFGDILTVEEGKGLEFLEQKMKNRDQNITNGYEIKNEFESFLYQTKEKIPNYEEFSSQDEVESLNRMLNEASEWLNSSDSHATGEFTHKIEGINRVLMPIKQRKDNKDKIESLRSEYEGLVGVVTKLHNNEKVQSELSAIESKVIELYNKESSSLWEGRYLNEKVFMGMIESVRRLK